MSETNLIDELYLTVRVPTDLPEDKLDAIRRTLADDGFVDRLRNAVLSVFRERPELGVASVSVTR